MRVCSDSHYGVQYFTEKCDEKHMIADKDKSDNEKSNLAKWGECVHYTDKYVKLTKKAAAKDGKKANASALKAGAFAIAALVASQF